MGRFAAWVEPALIAEWMRLMRDYAARQKRVLDEGAMAAAMTWAEPARDVALPRAGPGAASARRGALHCVSGRKLTAGTMDIDHCLPWSAWPCGDQWNLSPAHPEVNQRQKRERLPGADLLRAAAAPILPGLVALEPVPPPEEVFAALHVQRLRWGHDQQAPEWSRMPGWARRAASQAPERE